MAPKISTAEWDIMSVIWEKGRVSAAEVYDALPPGHGWKQKTVNTFLTRLVSKGALSVDKKERAHVYSARVARAECVGTESESFLRRVFQGATGELVLHFCSSGDLTADEIRELEAVLKARKGRE